MLEDHRLSRREVLLKGAAGGLAVAGLGELALPNAFAASERVQLKRGGNFRIGIGGGSDKEAIDAQNSVLDPDAARLVAMFEGLTYYDQNYKLQMGLAEEFSSTNGKVWTIRIRDGIEFHNGKTLTADDVVYSIKRMLDKSLALYATSQIAGSVVASGIKKMDKKTVRLTLAAPNSVLPDAFGQYFMNIVPVGYKSLKMRRQADRDRAVQVQELHAGPALGAPAQPELLADRAALLRQGHGHRHRRRQRARQRADRRPGRRDRRDPVPAGLEPAEQGLQDPEQRRRRLGADHDGAWTRRRSPTPACARRSG